MSVCVGVWAVSVRIPPLGPFIPPPLICFRDFIIVLECLFYNDSSQLVNNNVVQVINVKLVLEASYRCFISSIQIASCVIKYHQTSVIVPDARIYVVINEDLSVLNIGRVKDMVTTFTRKSPFRKSHVRQIQAL